MQSCCTSFCRLEEPFPAEYRKGCSPQFSVPYASHLTGVNHITQAGVLSALVGPWFLSKGVQWQEKHLPIGIHLKDIEGLLVSSDWSKDEAVSIAYRSHGVLILNVVAVSILDQPYDCSESRSS